MGRTLLALRSPFRYLFNVKKSKEEIARCIESTLAAKPEILFAYLFGSFVESENFGDVDVAVYVDTAAYTGDTLQYSLRLGNALERTVGYPLDLILINEAPDHLIHRISEGTLIVDRDDDFRIDFLSRAWKRYFDIEPKRRQAYLDMLS